MIYKLKLWVDRDEEGEEWSDLYFDVSKITGFYIPDRLGDTEHRGIYLWFDGDAMTIKQEDHIMTYLLEYFVSEAVENKTTSNK